MEQEDDCPECEAAAGWIMTFADLMSLLMCFFVLLLSFSEMDVQKYKQVAGSMKFAFGVQREIDVDQIPKGTSIVAQEFSPGKPQPTPISEVRQITTEEFKQNLDFDQGKSSEDIEKLKKILHKKAIEKARELSKALKKEIENGLVEVKVKNEKVIINIREKGAFPSGTDEIQPGFVPVLTRISTALNKVDGRILVAGHTDNIPIRTRRFPSNWVLSSARAANVVHFMTTQGNIAPKRVEIRAHADMAPLVDNKSSENRSRNRRVEIIILGDYSSLKSIQENRQKTSSVDNTSATEQATPNESAKVEDILTRTTLTTSETDHEPSG